MGRWTLTNIGADTSNLDGESFGHRFIVTFVIRYDPVAGEGFTELPRLDWSETITVKDWLTQPRPTYWKFDADNLYARKPRSPTFGPWEHWLTLAHHSVRTGAGHEVTLLQLNGQRITADVPWSANQSVPWNTQYDTASQDEAVRRYLQAYGGLLRIQIRDVPSLGVPRGVAVQKERLLQFDCGLVGSPQRVRAAQRLYVDTRQHRAHWHRQMGAHDAFTLSLTGFDRVFTPLNVTDVDFRLRRY
jgi:hypothetical protein